MNDLIKLCDIYAGEWLGKGAYEVHFKHCATGYIQSFAIRTLCAGHKLTGNVDYRSAAVRWADLTVRLQGTQGHLDAYNMGYHNPVRRDGVPEAWYPADCGDIALSVLDVASILDEDDAEKRRLLDSVIRYADYVLDHWSNDDGSVGGFVEDYEEFHYNFWCADSRMCNVLWGLVDLGRDEYADRAVALTWHSATIDQNRRNHEGKPITDYGYPLAVYMSDAICNGLGRLGNDQEDVRRECVKHLAERFLKWVVENQLKTGTWIKRKSGLDEEAVGGYHGCLLANLMLSKPWLASNPAWKPTAGKALAAARQVVNSPEDLNGPNKWGCNATLGLGIAAALDPKSIFPLKAN